MASYYFIKSKLDGNVIDIQGASTKSGVQLDAWPQKTSGTDNQLWEFVADPAGSGYFFIKSKLDGNVIDIEQASTTPGTLLDAWPQKTSGTDNQLWQFYKDPGGSGYYFIQSKLDCTVVDIKGASTTAGALLDAWPLKSSGTNNQLWEVVSGSFPSPVSAEPAPSAGLGSNSNYFLSNCNDITGLSVTVNVTQGIVGSDGFGFQVNAYSAKAQYDGGQQYLIYLDPHSSPAQLYCMVDNWTESPSLGQIINHIVPLATLPSQELPAGYTLKITLNYSGSAVSGANYIVMDNTGKTIGNQTITLLSLKLVNGNPVTSADLAPIVSFQLNFVDYLNGGITTLSSGAGTLTYNASVPMSILNTEPSCVDWDFSTVERANSSYGVLPAHANNVFVQTFEKSGAVIDRQAKVRHITRRVATS
jgi:Ricin-type beta-trefoil lectin domain-like